MFSGLLGGFIAPNLIFSAPVLVSTALPVAIPFAIAASLIPARLNAAYTIGKEENRQKKAAARKTQAPPRDFD